MTCNVSNTCNTINSIMPPKLKQPITTLPNPKRPNTTPDTLTVQFEDLEYIHYGPFKTENARSGQAALPAVFCWSNSSAGLFRPLIYFEPIRYNRTKY